MKKIVFVFMLFLTVFFSLYAQAEIASVFVQEGIASWYGNEYNGRLTASGEIFDSSLLTAAHPSLPFGTVVTVTNQHNNRTVTVRINDRGPFVPARIIDVSRAAAEQLDMIITGTAPVKVEQVVPVQQLIPQETIQAVHVQPAVVIETMPSVQAAPVVIQPIVTQIPQQAPIICTLIPLITVAPDKLYRLQVGSYKNPRNAVDAFDRLKNAGLNPAYERYMDGESSEYFRVVLAGVRGIDVQLIVNKLGEAGFREALIREENQ